MSDLIHILQEQSQSLQKEQDANEIRGESRQAHYLKDRFHSMQIIHGWLFVSFCITFVLVTIILIAQGFSWKVWMTWCILNALFPWWGLPAYYYGQYAMHFIHGQMMAIPLSKSR
jgi:Flp pilus assembly protein TadB